MKTTIGKVKDILLFLVKPCILIIVGILLAFLSCADKGDIDYTSGPC